MTGKPVLSNDVFKWPEFRDFARRLSIDTTRPYRSITIEMVVGAATIVCTEEIAREHDGDDDLLNSKEGTDKHHRP